jgi:hypothetical protein
MISKPVPANSFYYTCRYILNKPGAEMLLVEGVRGHDYKLMAEDFERQQQLRPSKEMACFHAVLSFHPTESPTNETVQQIAQEYLKRLGIVNTQFAITRHTDTNHPHLHLVANMVNNDGKAISDSWIGLRGKKVAQQLTQEYKLVQVPEKNLKLTHLENMNEYEVTKYKIFITISEQLAHARSIEELTQLLHRQGVETLYKYKGQTDEKQGISFRMGEYSFKGSQVDRKFSLGNLEKTLALQQKQIQEQQVQAPKRELNRDLSVQQLDVSRREQVHKAADHAKDIGTHIARGVEKSIEILMKPEEAYNAMPYELTQEGHEQNRKKKKHENDQSHGLHR